MKRISLLLVSAVIMGSLIWATRSFFLSGIEMEKFFFRMVAVSGMIGFGAIAYFVIAVGSGAIDRAQVKRLLRR